MKAHLSDDQLIDRLYGLAGEQNHLADCPQCSARFDAMEIRRREMARLAPPSAEVLAAQRRVIHSRLGERPNRRMKWIPAMAAGALAIAALVYRPAVPPAPHPDPADAQLFSEVYSMEQSTEPTAAAPIHGLFEDNDQ